MIQSSEAAPPTLEGSFEIVSVTSVEFHNKFNNVAEAV